MTEFINKYLKYFNPKYKYEMLMVVVSALVLDITQNPYIAYGVFLTYKALYHLLKIKKDLPPTWMYFVYYFISYYMILII